MCYISSASLEDCDCPPDCDNCGEMIRNWYEGSINTLDGDAVCDSCIENSFVCGVCEKPFDLQEALKRGPLDWANDENICPDCAKQLADEGNDPADPKTVYALA